MNKCRLLPPSFRFLMLNQPIKTGHAKYDISILQLDKKVIQEIANGDEAAQNKSLVKRDCGTKVNCL